VSLFNHQDEALTEIGYMRGLIEHRENMVQRDIAELKLAVGSLEGTINNRRIPASAIDDLQECVANLKFELRDGEWQEAKARVEHLCDIILQLKMDDE
jgi:hypothetical protein